MGRIKRRLRGMNLWLSCNSKLERKKKCLKRKSEMFVQKYQR